jgi:hypothetical protein
METLPDRVSRALLILLGLATVLSAPPLTADRADLVPALYHLYVVLLLALALLVAAFVPAIRLPVVGAALVVKAGFVAIALSTATTPASVRHAELVVFAGLLGLAALLLKAWRREARWDGRAGGHMGA